MTIPESYTRILRKVVSKICHLTCELITKFLPKRGCVLMIHWVGDEELAPEHELYRLSVLSFTNLITWLKEFKIINLSQWESHRNFYALTIDDVPESFYTNAFPLLQREGIPFTIFVNTSLLGTNGYISYQQLIEMSRSELCTVGSHGVTHKEFFLFNREQFIEELINSKEILEQLIHKPIELFAFPFGSYYACGFVNKNLVCNVYKYGFSTVSSPITTPKIYNNFFLPRVNVDTKFVNKIR